MRIEMKATVTCARCGATATTEVHSSYVNSGPHKMFTITMPPGWGHYVIQQYGGYSADGGSRATGDTRDLCGRCAATATIAELTAGSVSSFAPAGMPPWAQ